MNIPAPAADPSYEYWQSYSAQLPSLGEAWMSACLRPGNPVVLKDTLGARLKAKTALVGSIILSGHIRRLSNEQNIGILLPSSSASVLCNMGTQLLGKTCVNLNFTASAEALLSSVQQAEIKTIYTSARFIERLNARGVDVDKLQEVCKFVLLEDLRAQTRIWHKLYTLACCHLLPKRYLLQRYCTPVNNDQTAVILFSSGSEGNPKGVMLSHRNLMANVKQTAQLFKFSTDDLLLANLPPFHAFGLTVTYLLPLLERTPVLCHADPTDVVAGAKAIAEHKVTVMLGTSSFFRLYVQNNKVTPDLLASITLIFAGAEKLQPATYQGFLEKFGKEIYEGYGATETAPVASANLPEMKRPAWLPTKIINKTGSVGLPLPGTTYRIADPDTFVTLPTASAGMVLIGGPQIMKGYHKNPEQTQFALRNIDGQMWYVTGDKGYLDADGFLFILDRYSRFAKIGGEMVGLGTVEHAIRQAMENPDLDILVVNLPDDRKGEKLIALTTIHVNPQLLRDRLLATGFKALSLPAAYYIVEAIPKLGSGKTDFTGAKILAATLCAADQ